MLPGEGEGASSCANHVKSNLEMSVSASAALVAAVPSLGVARPPWLGGVLRVGRARPGIPALPLPSLHITNFRRPACAVAIRSGGRIPTDLVRFGEPAAARRCALWCSDPSTAVRGVRGCARRTGAACGAGVPLDGTKEWHATVGSGVRAVATGGAARVARAAARSGRGAIAAQHAGGRPGSVAPTSGALHGALRGGGCVVATGQASGKDHIRRCFGTVFRWRGRVAFVTLSRWRVWELVILSGIRVSTLASIHAPAIQHSDV